jgi:hypothetical protein
MQVDLHTHPVVNLEPLVEGPDEVTGVDSGVGVKAGHDFLWERANTGKGDRAVSVIRDRTAHRQKPAGSTIVIWQPPSVNVRLHSDE